MITYYVYFSKEAHYKFYFIDSRLFNLSTQFFSFLLYAWVCEYRNNSKCKIGQI